MRRPRSAVREVRIFAGPGSHKAGPLLAALDPRAAGDGPAGSVRPGVVWGSIRTRPAVSALRLPPQRFGSTGPKQSGETNYFPRMHIEADITHPPAHGEVFYIQKGLIFLFQTCIGNLMKACLLGGR